MKRNMIFYFLTATAYLVLLCWNKRSPSQKLTLAAGSTLVWLDRISHGLKRLILRNGLLSFLGVWLTHTVCNKLWHRAAHVR